MSILASFRHVSAVNSLSGRRLCRRGHGHRRLSTFPRFPPPFSAPLKHVRTLSNSVASSPDSGFLHSPVFAVNAAFDSAVLRSLSSRQKEQISRFVGALLEWNERMNLTAVTEESEVMRRHVEDSLALLPPLRRSYLSKCFSTSDSASSLDCLRLVDVGSGSGLPGLIFAIACPTWKVTLLESMHKRCLFLEHVVGLIGLSNVQVLRERAEIVGQSLDFREQFDVAVARAVAEMRILVEYCLPLVRIGGLFLAAKGHNPQIEIRSAEKAIQLMGGSILDLCSVESHSPVGQRTAVVCLKKHSTPKRYPRHTGVPSRMPI